MADRPESDPSSDRVAGLKGSVPVQDQYQDRCVLCQILTQAGIVTSGLLSA